MALTAAPAVHRWTSVRRFFARGWAAAAVQVLVVLGLFLLYRAGRLLAGDDVQRALSNGSSLWRFERTIHLPSEETFQDLFLGDRTIVHGANWYYVGAHFPVTILFLALVFARARPHYARVRNAMALATTFGLAIHILYPLAPPRLLGNIDMVDTGSVFGPSPYKGAVQTAANQFAAMPSLHVGWAVLVGIVTWRLAPHALRWVGWLHAALTTVVVVITANHYWIDAVVGTAVVLVALRLTRPRTVRLLPDDDGLPDAIARATTGEPSLFAPAERR